MLNITKRGFVKIAARSTVNVVVYNATLAAANQIFDPEPDTATKQVVEAGSLITGVATSTMLRNRIDSAVDRVADWRINRKEMKAANAS